MNGIQEYFDGNISLFIIETFSDDLKERIKNQLTEICHGEYALVDDFEQYSFENTIDELVNHRLSGDKRRIMGCVGELLLNVIIREYFDIKIISPFFNMEERSPKKGFDIIALDREQEIWLIEAKAGESHHYLDSTTVANSKMSEAKRDLESRLSSGNTYIWTNAINSVKAYINNEDEKSTVMKILSDVSKSKSSKDKNVVLGGIVFCIIKSPIDFDKLKIKCHKILSSSIFGKIKLVAIQQETYIEIFNYLASLC